MLKAVTKNVCEKYVALPGLKPQTLRILREEGSGNNTAANGGSRKKKSGMELLEHSAQRGFRPQHVEGKCPC
jgi:hypothetical protein